MVHVHRDRAANDVFLLNVLERMITSFRKAVITGEPADMHIVLSDAQQTERLLRIAVITACVLLDKLDMDDAATAEMFAAQRAAIRESA